MFDAFTLGRNFHAVTFCDELKDSAISLNTTVNNFPTIVTEQLQLELEIPPTQLNDAINIRCYQSRIGQFEDLKSINLAADFLGIFQPNFDDPEMCDFELRGEAFNRVLDIHSNGAVLFHTTIAHRRESGELELQDAGYFIQLRFDSAAIPIPEEEVTGFTKDKQKIVICCLTESQRSKILCYDPIKDDFKTISFTESNVEFLDGALEDKFLCLIEASGPDGTLVPQLADASNGKMREIKHIENFAGLSFSGVVIGHATDNTSKIHSRYMHSCGRGGILKEFDSDYAASIVNGITEIKLQENSYFLATGSSSEITDVEHNLIGASFRSNPKRGLIWIASDTELRNGTAVMAEDITARMTDFDEPIISVHKPQPDMRLVGETKRENLLLVPID